MASLKPWQILGFGPQPVPEDKRIFNRPGNPQPISKFFDEIAQAIEDRDGNDNGHSDSKQERK